LPEINTSAAFQDKIQAAIELLNITCSELKKGRC